VFIFVVVIFMLVTMLVAVLFVMMMGVARETIIALIGRDCDAEKASITHKRQTKTATLNLHLATR
jgi:beta-lactam-binding protein with PASTA domain